MPIATVNGIRISFEDGGAGPAVLLSHGYSATGHMWAPQRPAVEPRYRLVTWDMRGHGETDAPDDPAQDSHALTVADMRALLGHLGIGRAVIGGLSLGGTMSLAFWGAHPELVRALVICDSGPGFRNAEARESWNRRAHERAAELEARGLALAARGMLTQPDARLMDLLPGIRVPTLVVVGDRDTPFIAACEYMARKIPGGAPRGDPRRRALVEPGPARGVQPDPPRLPGRAARGLMPRRAGSAILPGAGPGGGPPGRANTDKGEH